VIYEILNGCTLLATLPGGGQSPQLAALRRTYDLSLQVDGPLTLWKLALGGPEALEICRVHRGAFLPLTEA